MQGVKILESSILILAAKRLAIWNIGGLHSDYLCPKCRALPFMLDINSLKTFRFQALT